MSGTDDDYAILHERAVFNMKKEKEEAVISSLSVNVEVDTYNSPAPRGPDVVMLSSSPATTATVSSPAVAPGGGQTDGAGWGAGHVGTAKWDTAGFKPDITANKILSLVQADELTAAEICVTEAAVDLPLSQRVPVERSGLPLLPSDLVAPFAGSGGGEEVVDESLEQGALQESDYESEDSLQPDLDQRIEDEAFRWVEKFCYFLSSVSRG